MWKTYERVHETILPQVRRKDGFGGETLLIVAIILWGLACLFVEYVLGINMTNANLIASLLFALMIGAMFETVKVR